MFADVYFENMKKVLEKIEKTQKDTIVKCAEVIARSLTGNGMWHILDTGHMLMHEAVGRSGGMMALRPIKTTVAVENPTRQRINPDKKSVYLDEIAGFPEFVLGKANVMAGDVLIVGSVSGKNILPVEMALKAKAMGVHTIALTSVEYSSYLKADHPSGKKLYEVCDYVLDNCGNVSDTLMYVKEIEKGICPSSGVAAAYLIWALQAEVVEKLIAMGKTPGVYVSNHMENAGKMNSLSWLQYEKQGF